MEEINDLPEVAKLSFYVAEIQDKKSDSNLCPKSWIVTFQGYHDPRTAEHG